MLIIGLTGGIGSGKSTVCQHFAALGVPIIDADEIAHALVEPGQPTLTDITKAFGNSILNRDGSLNRGKLRNIVFSDPEQRQSLEAILHPRIRDEMLQRARALNTPYCLFSIPLLVETAQMDLVDRVLVIDTDETQQRTRIKQRDNLSDPEIDAILKAQCNRQARLDIADDVIINNDDLEKLVKQVEKYHHQYLAIASAKQKKA